jgi:hypothetical protein
MFNDLDKPNPTNHQAVDDIFADTDKTEGSVGSAATNQSSAVIDAHKVGLTADGENQTKLSGKVEGNKSYKIIVTSIIVLIVILAGYLAYTKFFANSYESSPEPAVSSRTATPVPVATPAVSNNVATTSNGIVDNSVASSSNSLATSSPSLTPVPLIPGVNAPAATGTAVSSSTGTITPALDSDSDGLSDAEEKTYGTNIKAVDTDGDGLSDYEEVKIYHTDPLNPDTDGDGFTDGQEVKLGYNPLGAGKMVNNSPANQ